MSRFACHPHVVARALGIPPTRSSGGLTMIVSVGTRTWVSSRRPWGWRMLSCRMRPAPPTRALPGPRLVSCSPPHRLHTRKQIDLHRAAQLPSVTQRLPSCCDRRQAHHGLHLGRGADECMTGVIMEMCVKSFMNPTSDPTRSPRISAMCVFGWVLYSCHAAAPHVAWWV